MCIKLSLLGCTFNKISDYLRTYIIIYNYNNIEIISIMFKYI